MKHHRQHPADFVTQATCLLALTLTICGCATTKKPEEEKPKKSPPKLVGIIASIPPDRTYVLIQSYGPWETPTGAILTSRGLDNRTANLLFTGEKLGHFAAADIQSGSVDKGDAVYAHHIPKPESAPTETNTTPAPNTPPPTPRPQHPKHYPKPSQLHHSTNSPPPNSSEQFRRV